MFVFAYNRARISKAAGNNTEGKQLQSMLRKLNAMDALLEPHTDCGKDMLTFVFITSVNLTGAYLTDQSTFSILMQIRGNSERLGSVSLEKFRSDFGF